MSPLDWTCRKVSKKTDHCFCFYPELRVTWLIIKYEHRLWMAARYPLWVLFLKYIMKHSVSSLLPPFTRTGLYNQSNIQFLKIAAACAIIFCLFFMANVWKALIATHFSLRLAFFQEFFSSSVSLVWQTKDFSPLGNKTKLFQEDCRWALPT